MWWKMHPWTSARLFHHFLKFHCMSGGPELSEQDWTSWDQLIGPADNELIAFESGEKCKFLDLWNIMNDEPVRGYCCRNVLGCRVLSVLCLKRSHFLFFCTNTLFAHRRAETRYVTQNPPASASGASEWHELITVVLQLHRDLCDVIFMSVSLICCWMSSRCEPQQVGGFIRRLTEQLKLHPPAHLAVTLTEECLQVRDTKQEQRCIPPLQTR